MTEQSLFSERSGIVILAAGKGTRMYSDTPKVLMRLLEEPMLRYVHGAAAEVCGNNVRVVIGHGAQQVRAAFPELEGSFILQERQLGTGHALQTAWPFIQAKRLEYVVVVNGDTPLISAGVLRSFLQTAVREEADLSFISLRLADAGAFGRVVRDNGVVTAIVEAKDYDASVHGPDPKEVNAGIYCFKVQSMGELLPRLSDKNASGELYITDLVDLAVAEQLRVTAQLWENPDLLGVNTPKELAQAEEVLRAQIVEAHMARGVLVRAAHSVRIGPDARIAPGVEITGPCEIYGKSVLDAGTGIASHCRLHNARLGRGVVMHSFCHVQDAAIADGCIVGPYARLRPGAELDEGAHVGNFVELKKARLGKGSKANHLSYIGDAQVGAGVNIGAGTITCNYDGKNKHVTHIDDGAFIGSNTALVAPVRIGKRALVGAGSVITTNVPDGSLGITRPPQKNLPRRLPDKD